MAVRNAYTLSEAREMLQLWKECEKSLVTGQVQSYRVGTRELSMLDISEIRDQIRYFSDIIDSITGTTRSRRVACVVPRDL